MMRVSSVVKAAVAWAALAGTCVGAAGAQAQQKRCIPSGQARALIATVLPPVLDEVGRRCAQMLPAGARLSAMPERMRGDYRAAADAAWPDALKAFAGIVGHELSETEALFARPMVEALIGPALIEKIQTQDCPAINDLVTALEPLPPANLASAVVAIVEISGADKKDKSPLQICPRTRR